jgi:hypothetical protein
MHCTWRIQWSSKPVGDRHAASWLAYQAWELCSWFQDHGAWPETQRRLSGSSSTDQQPFKTSPFFPFQHCSPWPTQLSHQGCNHRLCFHFCVFAMSVSRNIAAVFVGSEEQVPAVDWYMFVFSEVSQRGKINLAINCWSTPTQENVN